MNGKQLFRTMKTGLSLLTLVFSLTLITSCEKPEDDPSLFDLVAPEDIAMLEEDMEAGPMTISNANGVQWEPGDVFIYKTNQGRFGKFEVISVNQAENYKLTIKAVTYDTGGVIHSQTSSLSIRGTWLCDLDTMTEVGIDGTEDFKVSRDTEVNTSLLPTLTAVFSAY